MKRYEGLNADEYATLFKGLRKRAEAKGGYKFSPTWKLITRGLRYYKAHELDFIVALNNAGLKETTVKAVMNDYRNYCVGLYVASASLEQMREVIELLKPYYVYKADKYVAFLLLFTFYFTCTSLEKDYRTQVKEATDTGTKTAFLLRNFGATEAKALLMLKSDRIAVAEDFMDVEPTLVAAVFSKIERTDIFWDYLFFCSTAEMAYNATDTEIEKVAAPPAMINGDELAPENARAIAHKLAGLTQQMLEQLEGQPIASSQVKQQLQRCYSNIDQMLFWGQGALYSEIEQKDITIKERQAYKIRYLPQLLDDFTKNPSNAEDFRNPRKRIRANQGVQNPQPLKTWLARRALQAAATMITEKGYRNGDDYTATATLREFAGYCGYDNPSGQQLKNCLSGLASLTGVMFYYKYYFTDRTTGKRKVTEKLTLAVKPELERTGSINEETGNINKGNPWTIKISMPASLFEGKPKLYIKEGFNDFIREADSDRKDALRQLLLLRTHIKQSGMVKEVFEYDAKLAIARERDEAENDKTKADNERKFLRDWQKHFSRYVEFVETWLKAWNKNGYIKDYEAHPGEGGEIVYQWKLGTRLKPETEKKQDKTDTETEAKDGQTT